MLFEEKIELFVKLLDEKPVTWSGTTRAALENADVFPKTESGRLTPGSASAARRSRSSAPPATGCR